MTKTPSAPDAAPIKNQKYLGTSFLYQCLQVGGFLYSGVLIAANEQKDVIVRLKLSSEMNFRPTADMKRDNTIQTEDIYALLPIEDMNRCLDLNGASATGETRVVIYLGDNGKARGIELEGTAADNSVIKECLTRQAATVVYRPLVGGDYAVFAIVLGESR